MIKTINREECRVCDKCEYDAPEYILDGEEFCEDCMKELIDNAWNDLDYDTKAAMLEMELEKIND